MNTIARFLIVSACAALAVGCDRDKAPGEAGSVEDRSPQAEPAKNAKDAMEYTSAEVELVAGNLAGHKKRMKDQAQIRRLLSQFPGAGTGKKGPEPPAPWTNALVVQFTKSDGTVLRVTSSAIISIEAQPKGNKLYFWSEGQEDWIVDDPKEFHSYFRKLFEKESKSEKQSQP